MFNELKIKSVFFLPVENIRSFLDEKQLLTLNSFSVVILIDILCDNYIATVPCIIYLLQTLVIKSS